MKAHGLKTQGLPAVWPQAAAPPETNPIAVIGMACRYPDAASPADLWCTVMAQRRAFRRIPDVRLRLEDLAAQDAGDSTYVTEAAVIADHDFDRVRFRITGSTYRSTDPVHWLALEVTDQALADAGLGEALPRATTGVLIGNTLAGEHTRASTLRLRWPYVRRVVAAELADKGWDRAALADFLEALEVRFKAPFAPMTEDSLAGSLPSTIAGRICNHFDLGGGGYTVDGACAGSLLAVITACQALRAGDLDVAVAGGVDLSLDPFELVGFARAGALARDEMRVYDEQSAGFWPGEGCGVVVLARLDDALAQGLRVRAVIRGWGLSSDGSGGITRPEVEGQLLALRRAYARAGVGPDTVALFEGHGTGTQVGDATELEALSRARREAEPGAAPAALGSIKANIGHTKAAAGMAGLIKAAMAVQARVLPPTTGCVRPHAMLTGPAPALRVLPRAEPWPAGQPVRAAVSAMGFGGINTHVVLDGPGEEAGPRVADERVARAGSEPPAWSWVSAAQDAEVFVLAAETLADLHAALDRLGALAGRLSRAEMSDLAATLAAADGLDSRPWRAAVVAARPAELARALAALRAGKSGPGAWLGQARAGARLAFLFPGQGSPVRRSAGALGLRFAAADAVYAEAARAGLPRLGDERSTAVAQPAMAAAALAGLRALAAVGIEADVAAGHSLGELAALCWAGALDEQCLLRLAALRGRIMEETSAPGAMASVAAPAAEVAEILASGQISGLVVVAGHNAPDQTTVAGEAAAVDEVMARARARSLAAVRLPVTRAFHSPLMEPAAAALRETLKDVPLGAPARPLVSTVTGAALAAGCDVAGLLARQLVAPVRFVDALHAMGPVDVCIEVGPGRVLAGLAAQHPRLARAAVVALDVGGASLRGLLEAVAAAFVSGAAVRPQALFADRFTRPLDLDWRPRFLASPCEQAPLDQVPAPRSVDGAIAGCADPESADHEAAASPAQAVDLVRRLVAARAELPVEAVTAHSRLLGDLHLGSLAVAELAAAAARALNRAPSVTPTEYARATVAELAAAVTALPPADSVQRAAPRAPAGVAQWVRVFAVTHEEEALPAREPATGQGAWRVLAPPDHALAGPVAAALADVPGSGVAVCMPPRPEERHIALLLDAARAVLDGVTEGKAQGEARPTRFVLVQHGSGGAAFARSLFQEAPHIDVCVVNLPADDPRAAERVAAEARAAAGHVEVWYDARGRRTRPALRALGQKAGSPPAIVPSVSTQPASLDPLPLGPDDHLLVSGGARGIGAECALALARASGAWVTLLGRTQPENDPALAANLRRFDGCRMRYVPADVTDAEAVRAAVDAAVRAAGRPVTALLHAAGHNQPRSLRDADAQAFRATLAPKLDGARHLLDAVDPGALRLLVGFGSVIARVGLHGQADYALANEWLTALIEDWRATHPACLCLCVEWSVWAGTGMGERLGSVDALAQAGITPIPIDEGVMLLDRLLRRLAADPEGLPTAVVVCGRLGAAPTLGWAREPLPLCRFLEHPRVHVPGVELIADARLCMDTDRYLDDHRVDGTVLLPAVMGLEAMAQAAVALTGASTPPCFHEVRFDRPVTVPAGGHTTVRVAALAREDGRVDAVIRSEETGFQVDHVRATLATEISGPATPLSAAPSTAPAAPLSAAPALETADKAAILDTAGEAAILDASGSLYGPDALLFHGPRFRRIRRYTEVRARSCAAQVDAAAIAPGAWFGIYLPATLILGDPAARDAAIHAVQACIPHRRLLPVAVERLWIAPERAGLAGALRVHARERAHTGERFVWDVEVRAQDGRVVERWSGLILHAAGPITMAEGWPPALLGPYIERAIAAGCGDVAVVIEQGDRREARRDRALRRLGAARWDHRPDGRLEAESRTGSLSMSHAGKLTLAVAAEGHSLGCDLERVSRGPRWSDILGAERLAMTRRIMAATGEALDVAATRLWSVGEAMEKAGLGPGAPLVLARVHDGWAELRSGALTIVTGVLSVRGVDARMVVAVARAAEEP